MSWRVFGVGHVAGRLGDGLHAIEQRLLPLPQHRPLPDVS